MAAVVLAVVAGWGKGFASSWPVRAKLLVVNFAFVFAFVLASSQNAKSDGKTKPADENAKRLMKNAPRRPKEITGGKAED